MRQASANPGGDIAQETEEPGRIMISVAPASANQPHAEMLRLRAHKATSDESNCRGIYMAAAGEFPNRQRMPSVDQHTFSWQASR